MDGCGDGECEHELGLCATPLRAKTLIIPRYNGEMPRVFDALLIVSFGGPEQREDVIPFLENVLRGRNVPRERVLAVADHYYHFGGRSPINDQNRALIAALREVVKIPIYWGNRNWHPLLADTVRQMRRRRHPPGDRVRNFGVRLLFRVPAVFGEHPARPGGGGGERAGDREDSAVFRAPAVSRSYDGSGARRAWPSCRSARVVFTAHSVPVSMAESESLCGATRSRLAARRRSRWACASGSWSTRAAAGRRPSPGLVPTFAIICGNRPSDTIIAPIGFLSDHMEVMYDLDTEARAVCEELGIRMVRAGTVGTHPAIIRMIAELIEREPEPCAATCCPAPQRPPSPAISR